MKARCFDKYKGDCSVQKDGDWYVAKCLENSVASQGKTIEKSTENLREALELFYEDSVEIALSKSSLPHS
ncbi:MAG: type II toxin-antitoxin system HicB family antitoxin [Clostridia bacterium]|nr:type II toxin-antitoxin system HicB family antitoxin [Clostridia bacterium]